MSDLQLPNREGFLEYFKVNKVSLQLCGILPIESRGGFVNGMVASISILTTAFFIFPAVCSMIFRRRFNPEEISEIISVTGILFGALLKLLALMIQRHKVASVVMNCERLWDFVKTKKDLLCVKPYALQGRQITYAVGVVDAITVVGYLVAPLIVLVIDEARNSTAPPSRKLPVPIGFVPDDDLLYAILYAIEIFVAFAVIVGFVSCDTIFASLLLHARGHLRMVQDWMSECKTMHLDGDKTILRSIAHHQRILDFTESVETIFSAGILIQIVVFLIVISFDGYNLLLNVADNFKYAMQIVAVTLQLLVYCWIPTGLIAESQAVANAAYNVPWYCLSPSSQKLIFIMMMRAQKPVTITAGKFAEMSMETFSSVISTTVSYFMVLKTTI